METPNTPYKFCYKLLVAIGQGLIASLVYSVLYGIPKIVLQKYTNYNFPFAADVIWVASAMFIGLGIGERVLPDKTSFEYKYRHFK